MIVKLLNIFKKKKHNTAITKIIEGSKYSYMKGSKKHNPHGPAVRYHDLTFSYHQNDQYHNIIGPAETVKIYRYNVFLKVYYVNGRFIGMK